jgi:hypothetical protein
MLPYNPNQRSAIGTPVMHSSAIANYTVAIDIESGLNHGNKCPLHRRCI